MLSVLGHPPVCLNRDLKFFRSQLCLGFNIMLMGVQEPRFLFLLILDCAFAVEGFQKLCFLQRTQSGAHESMGPFVITGPCMLLRTN